MDTERIYPFIVRFFFPINTIIRYTKGDCGIFAKAFVKKFGGIIYELRSPEWPNVRVAEDPTHFYNNPFHYIIRKDDHYLDAFGIYRNIDAMIVLHRYMLEREFPNHTFDEITLHKTFDIKAIECSLQELSVATTIIESLTAKDFDSNVRYHTKFVFPNRDAEIFYSGACGEFAKVMALKYHLPLYGLIQRGDDIPAHYVVSIHNRFVDVSGVYESNESMLTLWEAIGRSEGWSNNPILDIIDVDEETLNNADYECSIEMMDAAREYVELIDSITIYGFRI